MTFENRQRIWQVVRQIPAGKVASYGQVAQLAGLPRAARLVGNVLKKLPEDTGLPWYRVVNSQGRISFPIDSPSYIEQKTRLAAEGISFKEEKLLLTKYAWKP
ncbi:MAG: MGMT family protein [Pseudomonadales bacterium]